MEINSVKESGGPEMRPVIPEYSGRMKMEHSFMKFTLAMPGNFLKSVFTFNSACPCM
mgnify:CR=1 FL=1